MKIIRFIAIFSLIFYSGKLTAQSAYRAEFGLHSGVSYYLGDANSIIFKNSQPDYGMVFRYIFNERLLFQSEVNTTKILIDNELKPVNMIDVCGEFNFFDSDYKVYKPNSRKYTTYILAGVGLMNYQFEGAQDYKFSYNFGVGFKLRLIDRLKLNIQWSHKLLLSDGLEGKSEYENPSGLNGTNLLNNDVMSTFTIGLTYDIWKKGCNCHNSY